MSWYKSLFVFDVFRDVQCALHDDRNMEKVVFVPLEVGERQPFAFQHESAINLNYVSLKS